MSSKMKLTDVAYFSSEHPKNSVKNLLAGTGKWTTPANAKLDILEAEFCLPSQSKITGIDVGNYWSASLEVLVGLSEWPQSRREVLLSEHIFMNRIDCSVGDNKQTMMFFREEKFHKEVMSKKWDRVKVVCKQPFKFNNEVFGLGMFVIHGCIGESDGVADTIKVVEVNKSVMGSKFKAGLKPGLAEFMKKTDYTASTPKASHVPSVLKNLENQKRVVESDTGSSSFSSSFNASAMSRTARLVVQGQSLSGKQPNSFEKEAAQFLKECQFDKKPFAEIEVITFRKVKEIWLEKKKFELKKEEKDILKSLSTLYLSKLVNRNQKRPRDEGIENFPPKKRKVSDQVMTMRKNIDIDELEVIEDTSSMRNRIATMDMEKNEDKEKDDPENLALRKKYNQSKSNTSLQSNKSIRTPNLSQSRKHPGGTKTPINVGNKLGKVKTQDKSDNPTFDLDFSIEMSPNASPQKSKTYKEMIDQVKSKGVREPEYTKTSIKEKLSDQGEIATTSCTVSLACPLGKARMKVPCKASTCDHLQCFDAKVYVMMNEKKPKWICPVCNKPAKLENLLIDGFFLDIVRSSRLPANEHEIVLHNDGSWEPVPASAKKNSTPRPKPTTKIVTNVPNYNRKQLLSIPHDTLISSGILVQVYNYKKEKKLPLKGGTEISVKKGEPVAFFKVGPDIHLQLNGRFYLPDVQPEHMERVFKNFSSKEVLRNTFPDTLDKLLKLGGKEPYDSSQNDKEKKVVKSGVFDSSPSPHKPKNIESKKTPPPSTSPGQSGECPICSTTLPLSQLADHAAGCEVLMSDTEVEEGAGGSNGMVPCPICQLEMEHTVLEKHAITCAASMFGV